VEQLDQTDKKHSSQQQGFRRMCGAQAMKTQLNETGQVSHYLLWRLRWKRWFLSSRCSMYFWVKVLLFV